MNYEEQLKQKQYLNICEKVKAFFQDAETALTRMEEFSFEKKRNAIRQRGHWKREMAATSNQLAYLELLGVDLREHPNMSRQEAAYLIDCVKGF